jgi:uncharacterized repeat protein (TIGR01451 family)
MKIIKMAHISNLIMMMLPKKAAPVTKQSGLAASFVFLLKHIGGLLKAMSSWFYQDNGTQETQKPPLLGIKSSQAKNAKDGFFAGRLRLAGGFRYAPIGGWAGKLCSIASLVLILIVAQTITPTYSPTGGWSAGSGLFAQTSSPVVKFVTPPFISGCNNDTIKVLITNIYGGKGVTYSGPVKLSINVPGSPTIKYIGGTVSSMPAGATSASATGSTVNIDVPMPALGQTTTVKFVINADCNVLKLNPLPQFTGTATYPSPYPITGETFNSAVLAVGNAQLNLVDSGTMNSTIPFNTNVNNTNFFIDNGGYGSIDNVKITITRPTDLPPTINRIWNFPSTGNVANDWPPSTSTVVGLNTIEVLTVSGKYLGADGLLTPGERIQFVRRFTSLNECATYYSSYQVEYTCAGGSTVCDKPQTINSKITVAAGTPNLQASNKTIEYPDGCPKKKISYDVTNVATGNGAPSGNAYDVDLTVYFGGGLALFTDVRLNGVLVPVANLSTTGPASELVIKLKDLMTTDPDGAGGISDIDNDGFFDDMAPSAKTKISFEYSIPCDIACGANLFYNFYSVAYFTDFCRTLKGYSATGLDQFGFQQVKAIEQINTPDYGFFTATTAPVTKEAKFNFQYKALNMDMSAATAKLIINYSRTMEVTGSSIKINGVAPTNAPVLMGTGATFGGTAGVADTDSAWVITLTAAEAAALTDATPDVLSYDQTRYSCSGSRQATTNSDNWQLIFQTKQGLCTPGGETPCNFDLACKKAFSYTYNEGCGFIPCYVNTTKIERVSPIGSTSVAQTTPASPIDVSRSYTNDIVQITSNAFLTGDDPQEPMGFYLNQVGQAWRDLRMTFSLFYTTPKGWNGNTSIAQFLPGSGSGASVVGSKVVVRQRTPNPADGTVPGTIGAVLVEAPIILSDFIANWDGGSSASVQNNYNGPLDPVNAYDLAYIAANGANDWAWQGLIPPYVYRVNNGYSAINIGVQRLFNAEQTKAKDLYQLSVARALVRAGWTQQAGDDNFYYEVQTQWKMDETFPWDNSSGWSTSGHNFEHYGNWDFVGPNNVAAKYTTNGTCGNAQATHLTVTKDIVVENPKSAYSSDCGLRACNTLKLLSQEGDYFASPEVRVPYKLQKVEINLPSEYKINSPVSLQYNQGGAVQTSTAITASATTGAITFTNSGGGDFPRIDDQTGNKTAWNMCYDLAKQGTASPAKYKIPVKYTLTDEQGNTKILLDTMTINEGQPVLTLTAVAGSISIADGTTPAGKKCTTFYTDYKVTNNTLFDAPNVYLAAKGGASVTICNIQDVNPATPLAAADTVRYGTTNLFGKIGTVKAGDTRIIRVYSTTTACTGKVDVCADFNCAYPATNTPDETPANTNLVKASTAFTAEEPAMQTKPVSNLIVTDLCGTKTVEFEILNTKNANLFNLISTIKLPAGVDMVAGSLQAGASNNEGNVLYPAAVPAGNITNPGTGQYVVNFKDTTPFKTTECGLPGSDERKANVVRLKFDVSFSACPAGGFAQVLLESNATNYCGLTTNSKSAAILDFVGNAVPQNNFDLSHTDKPIKLCSPVANVPVVVTDTIYIKNLGGYGALSGPTAGRDTAYLAFPFSPTAFSVTNITVGNPANFGSFPVGTDLTGSPQVKVKIPAGVAVGDSIGVPVTYTITPKVAKLCEKKDLLLCVSAEFRSNYALDCPAKNLTCSATKVSYSSGLTPRTFKCCYGSIGDYVWSDVNNDGQQGAVGAEPPIKDVKVYLLDATTGQKLDSTLTDANGKYLFDSLFTGNYKVQFVKPADYIATKANTGADITDSDVGVGGISHPISIDGSLAATDTLRNNPHIDAGFVPVGSIGDYVFEDKNGDGKQDAGDAPVANVKVYLFDAAGNKIDSAITDATGKYLFKNVVSGTYSVQFVKPAGFDGFTNKDVGADGADSDADRTTGKTGAITVDATKPLGDPARNVTNVDAGLVKYGSIGDYVFEDKNADGKQDAGDAPIVGAKVYLLDAAGNKIDSTTTDGAGKYKFDSLIAGNYSVQFVKPAGFDGFTNKDVGPDTADSDADRTTGKTGSYTIDTTKPAGDPARDITSVDAGFVKYGSIGDYVFEDKNGDGKQDAGDAPIVGAKVYLLDAAGNKIDSTTTDGAGKYKFDSLIAGTYSVQFVKPAGFDGITNKDVGPDGADSDADRTTGKTGSYTIDTTKPAGDPARDITSVDAGFVKYGSIGDYVFEDKNKDGQQNAGDLPVANAKVYLLNAAGNKIDSTLTDAAGKYKFDSLIAGQYAIQVVKPAGFEGFTSKDLGADGTDSDVDKTTGKTANYTIDTSKPAGDPARDITTADAGLIRYGSIGDYMWIDTNKDGKQDAAELPLVGQKVYLWTADAAGNPLTKIDSAITSSTGKYLFDSLGDGNFVVQFTKPTNSLFTKSNIGDDTKDSDAGKTGISHKIAINTSLAVTDTLRNNPQIDGGIIPTGTVGDYVFYDLNADGVQDANELGIPGVKVYLLDNTGAKIDSTVTDGSGKYKFTVTAGDYQVQFVKPAGSTPTFTDQTGDTKDSDADVVTGKTPVFTMNPVLNPAPGDLATNNPTLDAGFIPLAPTGSIGDYVYFDNNSNGKQDAGDTPVVGSKVYLLDAAGTKIDSTLTDGAGKYLFKNLKSGTYFVQFTDPVGYDPTVANAGTDDTKDSDAGATGRSHPITIDVTKAPSDTLRNNPNIDAGFVKAYGSIGDYMWIDANKDGKQDAAELPLVGQKVYLWTADAAGNPIAKIDSAITSSTGKYLFDSLTNGNYVVQFTKPANSVFTKSNIGDDTKDSDPGKTGISQKISINVEKMPSDTLRNNPQIDAGIIPTGTVGDYVFYDLNADGIQTANELGVPGVKVYLLDNTGAKIDSTTTDGNGKYQFTVTAGDYQVQFVKPAGSTITTANEGTDDTKDSDADKITGKTPLFTMNPVLNPAPGDLASNNPTLDAGLIPAAPKGSIGDYVFLDNNGNGKQDAGDTPVVGSKVYLLNAAGVKIDSTLTDGNGKYLFANLNSGTYQVQFTKPVGFDPTTPNAGTDDTKDSDIGASSISHPVTIDVTKAPNDTLRNNPNIDAGFKKSYGSIGDYMWIDANNDGKQDAAELPLVGQKVYLLNAAGAKIDSAITDATGKYLFDSLVTGTYKVQFTKPANSIFTKSNIGDDTKDSDASKTGLSQPISIDVTKTPSDTLRNNPQIDAGIVPVGKLGDFVFYDLNADGIQTANELGVPGVKVILYDGVGNKIDSTVTGSDGKYEFTVPKGTYVVGFVAPTGSTITTKGQGGDPSKDSNADPVTGKSDPVVMNPVLNPLPGDLASNNPTIDAGLKPSAPKGSIGDYVFYDTNSDGKQDATDTPVVGQKVYLLNAAGTKIDSTVTDAAGKYTFGNLDAGTYQVQFTNPAGYEPTLSNVGTDDKKDSDAGINGKTQLITIDVTKAPLDTLRNNPQIDAGFKKAYGSIGNYMWIDANNDGKQDASELPLVGQKVYLLNAAGAKIDSAITDATGKYLFDSLVTGTYKVQFSKPANSVFAKSNIGDDTKDSDASKTGLSQPISIDTSKPMSDTLRNNPNIDAGIVPVGKLGDYVFYDLNADGIQDLNELGVPGVKVYLRDAAGTKIDSTVTDVNGKYEFTVPKGTYQVQFVAPVGSTLTNKDQGTSDAKDSDADKVTGITAPIVMDPVLNPLPGDLASNNPTIDAGLIPTAPKGSIGDFVFIDKNGDGKQDAGDTPVVGSKVYLLNAAGTKIDSTVTDASGKYMFGNLDAGTYKVQFTSPAGYEPTIANAGTDDKKDSDVGANGISHPITIDVTKSTADTLRNNPQIDAGFKKAYGSIGDYVWNDTNKDGKQDAGELPVAGVKVYLLDAAGTKIDSTTTDATGKYKFDSLTSGTYTVQFVAPAGTEFTAPNVGATDKDSDAGTNGKTAPITINTSKPAGDPARDVTTVDAGIVPKSTLGSIGNFVFEDKNKDGIQDATDTPIKGVVVKLLDGAGNVLKTTTTDVNGLYKFDSLPAGQYQVQFVKPLGFEATKQDILTNDAVDSDADAITGKTQVITLSPSSGGILKDNMTLDAGFYKPIAYGSIGDFVFNDLNKDGKQDAGDSPAAGVKVYLLDATGKKIDSTLTKADGSYKFINLTSGTYTVQFVAPAGQQFTTPNAGTDPAKDSDAGTNGKSAPIVIDTTKPAGDPGRDVVTVDAGLVPIPVLGSIGNYVFEDKNKDGLQDATDVPLKGIVVKLLDGAGNVLKTTTTDVNGLYKFDSLPAGQYQVQVVKPVGYDATTPNVGLDDAKDSDIDATGKTQVITLTPTAGGILKDNMTLDAGLFKPTAYGSIGDFVFNDLNKDGKQDASDTPAAGVKVYLLDGSGNKIDSTLTLPDGSYKFINLTSGTYTVQFVAPAGQQFTTPNAGTDPAKDSDAGTNGKSAPIVIDTTKPAGDPGRDVVTVDAGLIPATLGTIGDYVFEDKNKDGIQNAGDAPIAGVKVFLLNGAGVKLDSTTTDAAGKYEFKNLAAGTYQVQFVKPVGFDVTLANVGADDKDSDIDATGKTQVITLTPSAGGILKDNPTLDAGFSKPTAYGSIGDFVFNDVNKDGKQDVGDSPAAGVKVYLLDGSGNKIDSTITKADGSYKFDSLTSGTYTVQFVAPAGKQFTTPNAGTDPSKDSDAGTNGKTAPIVIDTTKPVGDPGRDVVTVDAGLESKTVDPNCITTPPVSVLGATVTACKNSPYPTLKAMLMGTGVVDWYKKPTGGTALATATLNYTPSGNVMTNDTFYLAARSTLVGVECPPVMSRTRIIVVATVCDPKADLALKKSIDKSIAKIGDNVTFTIVLYNQGKTAVTGIEILDTLSSSFMYQSHIAPAGTTYNAATGIWNVGTMAATTDSLILKITAKILTEGVNFNRAEVSKMNGTDKDSTPNNNITTEDDQASVCVTVPIEFCDNSPIELAITAPAGYSSYTWYRNGVVIPGATTNTYTVTQDGDYTFVVTGGTVGTCQGSNCCPVRIVKVACPCPVPPCVPFKVIKSKKAAYQK